MSSERSFDALGAALWAPTRGAREAVAAFARARFDDASLDATVDDAARRELLEGLCAAGLWHETGLDDEAFARVRAVRVRDLLVLASDGPGARAAQALSEEANRRFAPWRSCGEGGARVSWHSFAWPPEARDELRLPADTLWTNVFRALHALELYPYVGLVDFDVMQHRRAALRAGAERAALDRGQRACAAGLRALTQDATLAAAWQVAVERGAKVPSWGACVARLKAAGRAPAGWPEGVPFAELASPFEPLLDVWALGYALAGSAAKPRLALVLG